MGTVKNAKFIVIVIIFKFTKGKKVENRLVPALYLNIAIYLSTRKTKNRFVKIIGRETGLILLK